MADLFLVLRRLAAMTVLASATSTALPATAAERTEAVKFKSGTTSATIQGSIKGDDFINYTLKANAGQVMSILFSPSNPRCYFNVLPPGSEEAIHMGSSVGNEFGGTLGASGEYRAQVYLIRAAARRNETCNYSITFEISAAPGSAGKTSAQGDFADGLMGGPDFWMVAGVPAGDVLNLRKTPSAKADIVMSFANDFILRNKGCKMEGGQRWCQVERPDNPSVHGWVAGKYLQEAKSDGGE